jgi:hypothetical protein
MRLITTPLIFMTLAISSSLGFELDWQWKLTGARDEQFEAVDTVAISIHFPELIPPDYLIGYDRFNVTINDTFPLAVLGATPLVTIHFDAGFLYFDHIIRVSLYYTNLVWKKDGMAQLDRFLLYKDPHPITGIHQWFADDSIVADTAAKTVSFVYYHPKYHPLRNGNSSDYSAIGGNKRSTIMIASTGYPFIFGLFYSSRDNGISRKSEMPYKSAPFAAYDHAAGRITLFPRDAALCIDEIGVYSPDGTEFGRFRNPGYNGGIPVGRISPGLWYIVTNRKSGVQSAHTIIVME